MKKNKTIFSNIKDEELKKRIGEIDIKGSLYFAYSGQKTQEERDVAWVNVLAAINKKIPVVFFGLNPTEKYKKYVKNVCKKLEVQPDTMAIALTGGSTGNPKIIQSNEEKIVIQEKYQIESLSIDNSVVIGDFRGLNHYSGLGQFLRAAFTGCPFVFIDSTKDYLDIVQDCIEKGVTCLDVSAMQWHGIARALEDNDLKWDLKIAVSTSGIIDEESIRILTERTPCKISCAYTMTEFGIVAEIGSEMLMKKYSSAGKPVPGVTISVVNENGKKCLPYEEGEIVVKSKFISYPNVSPFFSGDNGYLDEDGYLYVTGRKGDVLKIKGRRVNAMQIENAYKKYQSVVFGVPVPIMGGHEGVIVVETTDSVKKVYEYIKQAEPPVSVVCRPRWIFIAKKLPRMVSGKFDRMRIKDIYTKKIEDKKNNINNKEDFPKNDIEKKLLTIWENVLNAKGISRNDDFFELGGKSLRVMSMISRIRRVFGVNLTPVNILKNPTLKKMAQLISKNMNTN